MSKRECTIDETMAALIKGMLARGDDQSDVAAFFLVNSGRVSEIWNAKTLTGEKFAYVKPAHAVDLPPPFEKSPYELWQAGKWP